MTGYIETSSSCRGQVGDAVEVRREADVFVPATCTMWVDVIDHVLHRAGSMGLSVSHFFLAF